MAVCSLNAAVLDVGRSRSAIVEIGRTADQRMRATDTVVKPLFYTPLPCYTHRSRYFVRVHRLRISIVKRKRTNDVATTFVLLIHYTN